MKAGSEHELIAVRLLVAAALVLVLGPLGCAGEEHTEAQTVPAGGITDADEAEDDAEDGGVIGSRVGDPAEQEGSWCDSSATAVTSFRTRNSGKTVSLCMEGDLLTYVFGQLGDEPELVYSGPVLGDASGTAVLWGEGVSSLADLAADLESPDSVWGADPVVSQLAESSDTKGFFRIGAMTGLLDQSVYVFRRGGWEYTIVSEWGRGMNLPEMAGHESHSITVRSPAGKTYHPD